MFHKKSIYFKAVKVSVWSMMERPTAVTSMCTLFFVGDYQLPTPRDQGTIREYVECGEHWRRLKKRRV